jgi:hypothetical protein
VKGKQRVELVGRGAVLSRREGKHGRSEASLSGMRAGGKACVYLPESTSGIGVASLIDREVSKKHEGGTGEGVLRVATNELAQDRPRAP